LPDKETQLLSRFFAAAAFGLISLLPLAAQAQGAPEAAPRSAPQSAPQNSEAEWRTGVALMGEPKYPEGFPHFDYVNPDAPKGGTVRLGVQGTFDSFNLVVAGVRGELAAGLNLIYDTLMTSSLDEPSAEYGLIAEAMRYPADYSHVTFRLNPEARWHDGEPITVGDVIYSFDVLKTNSPSYAFYYRNVVSAEETGEGEVTFRFDEMNNRELPQIVGQLPILPRHWWEGTRPDGTQRDITQTTLERPLGSGAYRVGQFEAGRSVRYERVEDYWAEDLNVNVGKNNFDEIRFEYFRDATVLLEAFKGDQLDWRSENIARNWATAYDFPAVREGRVVLEEFDIRSSGRMQAFVFNLRRERFQDERVRRAFNYVFDFEDINRTIFFSQYTRIESYFEGTELASSGLPEGRELEILESLRGQIPEHVFTQPYENPSNATAAEKRDNQRRAIALLNEAGYELRGRQMVNVATGQPLTMEFLGFQPTDERYVLPYQQALARIGVGLTLRIVDPAQYQNRIRSFDFDVTTYVWGQSLSPGNEQRNYWGSESAERQGSQNIAGISDPAIDALIERVIFATDREDLVAATRALDRVLLAHHFVVPQWFSGTQRTVRWNRFSHPELMPEYGAAAFPTVWWFDREKAAQTGAAR
jgi:microcin C transport system substrate-binding protein